MPVPSAATLVRRYHHLDALALTALIWFLAKFLRYGFPPLFDRIQDAYGVSNAALGAAFTGLMLAYAAMQFPSGVLADRVGSVTVITAGGLLAAVAALVLAVDAPFAVLAGAMVLVGVGTGAHKTVAVRLLSLVYPSRTGRALGVMDTLGTLSGVAAPAAVVFFAARPGAFGAGWRTHFLVAGLAGVALTLAFAVRVPPHVPDGPTDGRTPAQGGDSSDETPDSETSGNETSGSETPESETAAIGGLRRYGALFREWRFSTFVAATVLFSLSYNGLVAFLPLYLTDEVGIASATANLLYGVLFVASPVQLATGDASDRVGALPILCLTLGVAAAALLSLVSLSAVGSPPLLGAAVLALGLGAHGFRPVRGAYLLSIVPTAIAGGSLGVVRTMLMGAGAIAPAIVGVLSETVGFRPAFWLLAGALVGAATLAGALWYSSE